MKTLIVYASKYGCTRDCAHDLKEALHGEVTVCSAKDQIPSIEQFDTVLIGGSIYMNAIQKSIQHFCNRNLQALLRKRIGLFICCYTSADTEGYMDSFFPKELLSHAVCKSVLGGEMRYDTMNVLYRKLFQSLKKMEGFRQGFQEPHLDHLAIECFASVMEKEQTRE